MTVCAKNGSLYAIYLGDPKDALTITLPAGVKASALTLLGSADPVKFTQDEGGPLKITPPAKLPNALGVAWKIDGVLPKK